MSFNKESVWQVIAVVAMSAFIGGAIERGIFASNAAAADDVETLDSKVDRAIIRLDNLTERLSNIEGKLDVALDASRSRRQQKE